MLHDGTSNRRRRPAPDQIYEQHESGEHNSSSSNKMERPSTRRRLNTSSTDQSASVTFAAFVHSTCTRNSMNPTNNPNTNLRCHQHHQRMQGKTSSSSSSSSSSSTTPCAASSHQTSSMPGILSPAAEEIGKASIQSAVECAERLRTTGHYDQAIDILERTYQYATTMVSPTNQINVPTLHILWQIGRTYHVALVLQPAMVIFEQVLLEAQQLSQHDIVADCLFRLAHMKQYTGDVRSAETYYRDALHVAIVIHGTKYHMDVATILYNMGMLAHGQGDLLPAQGLYEEAIRIASNASPRPAAASSSSASSSSQAQDNPNAAFISNALELVVQIIEETTGIGNGIGSDEEDDTLLAAIAQHPPLDILANADFIAVCEMHAKVDDSFCAAAA